MKTRAQRTCRQEASKVLRLELLESRQLLSVSSPSYPTFTETGLELAGFASVADGRLSLTRTSGGQAGAAWFEAKQYVSVDFETTFQFKMGDQSIPGLANNGDGFAFLIQNIGTELVNGPMGYNHTPNSIAIEFDSLRNTDVNTGWNPQDPSHSYISVQTRGADNNSSDQAHSLGFYDTQAAGWLLDDGQIHTARIAYQGGDLSVYVDNLTTPLIVVEIDLLDTLKLDAGTAWIGFTAGAGQRHDILNWQHTPLVDTTTTVAVIDAAVAEGDAGTSNLEVKVIRRGDLSGSTTVGWTTANDTAIAGPDYVAASGGLVFTPGEAEKTFVVAVKGDAVDELTRNLKLQLTGVSGATIVDGAAVGSILNDDARISIADAQVVEGNLTQRYVDDFVPVDGSGILSGRYAQVGPDGRLYVASQRTNEIKVFDAVTGRLINNLTAPGLDRPWPVTFGPDGRLYVSGLGSDDIYRFDVATGVGQVFVPTSANGGMTNSKGLAFGPDGHLYASSSKTSARLDSSNPGEVLDAVLKFNGQTGAFMGAIVQTGHGGLSNPSGVTFGPDGHLYVSSAGNNSVKKYNGATGAFLSTFVASDSGGLKNPHGLRFASDGSLHVASDFSREVLRYHGTTGAFLGRVAPLGAEIRPDDYLINTTAGPFGETFVSLGAGIFTLGTRVIRYAPSNHLAFTVSLSTASGVPVTVDLAALSGSAVAGADFHAVSGTIEFAPGETTKVVLVPVLDEAVLEANETLTVALANPVGAELADASAVGTIVNDDAPPTKFYVVDDGLLTNRTHEYNAGGGAVENYSLNSGNATPRGVATTIAGDKTWVIDANRKVFVYNTSGGVLGSWTAGTMASNAAPEDLTTNGADVWIVDAQSDKVFRYASGAGRLSGSQNAVSSFSLNSANRDPKGIVTDGTHLWVVNDSSTDKVFKYTLAGTLVGSWTISSANSKPTGITIDPANVSHMWIVDSGADRVYQYDAAVGRTSGSQNASTSFALASGNTNPQGIADPPPQSRLSQNDGRYAPSSRCAIDTALELWGRSSRREVEASRLRIKSDLSAPRENSAIDGSVAPARKIATSRVAFDRGEDQLTMVSSIGNDSVIDGIIEGSLDGTLAVVHEVL